MKLNVEYVLYSHICTANRPILLITKISTCQNILTPQIPKICDPILITLLKMQPYYGQSSRENATPSSGTTSLTQQNLQSCSCYCCFSSINKTACILWNSKQTSLTGKKNFNSLKYQFLFYSMVCAAEISSACRFSEFYDS